MDKEFFIQRYVVEGRTYTEIAKELGWNKTSVGYYINKYKIPKQDSKKRQKDRTPKGKNHPMHGKRGAKSSNFGRKHSKETKEKIGKAHRGKKLSAKQKKALIEASVKARKGKRKPDHLRKTPLYRAVRIMPEYQDWRFEVFQRDNFTCQKCFIKGNIVLNADHIKPLAAIIKEYKIKSVTDARGCEELWNINNGQTLCVECHKKTKTYGGNIKGKYK